MQQSDHAGLAFACAGFVMLSVGDSIVKGMAHLWAPTAIAATRYLLAAFALVALLMARHGRGALLVMPRPRLQWLRGGSVALGTIGMFTALALMPLAEATTITFVQPMITALLAAAFLGEKLRPPTIAATLVAFVGVVLVLRPNLAEIGLPALLPLMVAAFMAVLMIANRAAAGVAGVWAMQAYIAATASVVLVAGTIIGHFSGAERFVVHWPAWHVVARCAVVAVTATLGHLLIYMGTVRAGAATVAPMTYGQLLGAVSLGWLFFGEMPDTMALLGAAIIVGAGLYLWWIGRMPRPPVAAP